MTDEYKPKWGETAKEYCLRVIPVGDKCIGAKKCPYYLNSMCEKWNVCIIGDEKCGWCRGAVVHPERNEARK